MHSLQSYSLVHKLHSRYRHQTTLNASKQARLGTYRVTVRLDYITSNTHPNIGAVHFELIRALLPFGIVVELSLKSGPPGFILSS